MLRSGRSGSDGEFEGCWAFAGAAAFDFAVGAAGDMRLVAVDGGQATLTTYNHTGWDQYPAADAFGPSAPLMPMRLV